MNYNNQSLIHITVDDLQQEAGRYLGRILDEDEILIAKKGLESGLMTGIDAVFQTIFTEMITSK